MSIRATALAVAVLTGALLAPAASCQTKPALSPKETQLEEAIASGKVSRVRELLDQGVSPQALDKAGAPSLFWAFRDLSIMKLLLEKGADPNARLDYHGPRTNDMAPPAGMTPLISAAWFGQADAVRLLLAKGARADARDENGMTALHWVTGRPMGAPGPGTSCEQTVDALVAAGADIESRMKQEDMTPLHMAAATGDIAKVEILLRKGAKVNALTSKGETALMLAVDSPGGSMRPAKELMALVKALVAAGADRTVKTKYKKTAADLAKTRGQDEVAAYLATGKEPGPPSRPLPRPSRKLPIGKPKLANDMLVYGYAWLSDNVILMLVEDRMAGQPGITHWVKHDLATGRRTPVRGLSAGTFDLGRISPDGQWSLCVAQYADEWTAVDLGTGAKVRLPMPGATQNVVGNRYYVQEGGWLTATKLVCLAADTRTLAPCALIFDVRSPKAPKELRYTVPRGGSDELSTEAGGGTVLGLTPAGKALVFPATGLAHSSVSLVEFGIEKSGPGRRFDVTLPCKAAVQAVLSPKHDRIAWTLKVDAVKGSSVEIWVSRWDGANMRPVGAVDCDEAEAREMHGSVRWLPDGKRLSYFLRGRLYVMAAD